MEKRLWRTLGSFDFLHSLHISSTNVMWDTQHNNAGWACFRILSWKSWRLKIDLSGIWCMFGNHTFVAISWMCKKQTYVPHSSTESEIISRRNPAKDCGADRVFSSFVACGSVCLPGFVPGHGPTTLTRLQKCVQDIFQSPNFCSGPGISLSILSRRRWWTTWR